MKKKPLAFLDFDRTLFDLPRFMSEYLGLPHERHFPRMNALLSNNLLPDLSGYLYPDVRTFLERLKGTHTRVLLSRARTFTEYQRRKVLASGIATYLDDVILTPNDDKGAFAPQYLSRDTLGFFIDDNLEALEFMKKRSPNIETIYIDRRNVVTDVPGWVDRRITRLDEALG